MILPDPAISAMEIAINRALILDELSFKRITALKNKTIAIELLGINLHFYLAPNADGIQVLSTIGESQIVDTWIRGTPLAMLKMTMTDDRSGLFKGEVTIDGDMALGQKFQRILDDLDIDWEEPLSKVMGDVAAHQLGDFIRSFSHWAVNSVDSLTKTTGEYFQEESRDIVSVVEVERFVDKVDDLRADTDRTVLRLEKIRHKMKVS